MDKHLENIIEIKGGLSKKKIYRKFENKLNKIIIDFSDDKKDFHNFLNVYKILKNINITIPKIYEVHNSILIIVMEDFGEQKIDKICNEQNYYSFIKSSVECLVIIQNTLANDDLIKLKKYKYEEFKKDISEFILYFIPFKKILNFPIDQFYKIWKKIFENLKINFTSFAHKDFEFINLFFLNKNNSYLKIGVIDFQSAFISFVGWDLFSILENPRNNFSRKYNEELISYFYNSISTKLEFNEFRQQYYLLNLSRQTRLLGRWARLIDEKNDNISEDFIDSTYKKLTICLENIDNDELKSIYNKILDLN
ncbi:MAG: phosphotransferase [Alphaproteobacteria bacterium]